MNFVKKRPLLLLLFLGVCGFGIYYFFPEKKAEVTYEKARIQLGTLNLNISTTGNVTPRNRLQVKPPVAGRVEELFVNEGDSVSRGQVIGWVSSSERVALIDAARANGQEELERWQKIYKATPLIATITGTIIARNVEPGQTVANTDVIVVIADKLIVRATVDETDVAKIKAGQEATVTLDAYPNVQIPSSVEHVAFEAITLENVTVYEIDVIPNEPLGFMKSGMNAEIQISVDKVNDAYYLPLAAIQYDGSDPFIYVADAENNMVKTPIETGLQDNENVEIRGPVEANQIVFIPTISLDKKQGEANSSPFVPKPRRRNRTGAK